MGELEFEAWKAEERYKQTLMDHSDGDFKVKSAKRNVDSMAWLGGFRGDKTLLATRLEAIHGIF